MDTYERRGRGHDVAHVTGLDKAKLLIAFRGYTLKHAQRHDGYVDLLTTDREAGEDLLLRVVNARVGVDRVRAMRATLSTLTSERGILFATSFTEAARRELEDAPIEPFADHQSIVHHLSSTELYAQINAYIEALCVARCGQTPQSQADCAGVTAQPSAITKYTCRLRHISDNADIHYARGWHTLLTADLRHVIALSIASTESDAESRRGRE
jgi:hypothetical protein